MNDDTSPSAMINEISCSNFGNLIKTASENGTSIHRAKFNELKKILELPEGNNKQKSEKQKDSNEKSHYIPLSKRFS